MINKQVMESFLSQKSLALAGVSRSGKKFGNAILKELSQQGYKLFLIHPEVDEIDGNKCYASLAELPEEVQSLIVVVPPEQTEILVQDIPASGIQRVWMQQGSASPTAISYCEENDISLIHGECVLMYAQPQGLHKFHHWLWGVLGKGPKHSNSHGV